MTSQLNLPGWARMDAQILAPDPQAAAYIESMREAIVAMETKYGQLLSQQARSMPMLAYGSPALKARFPHSFTDGEAVFMSDDLLKSIALEDRGVAQAGPTALALLHEIRALLNHADRLRDFPQDVAQIAGETSAYAKMRMGFPEVKWPMAVEAQIAASALPSEDLERYSTMSEENIAREVLAAIERRCGPGSSNNPAANQIKDGLQSIGFAPVLCAHPTIRDRSVISVALAEDERGELLRASAKPDSLLFIAAERGDHAAAAVLLSISDAMERGPGGRTPLMAACAGGHAECAMVLAERTDLSLFDRDGMDAEGLAREAGMGDVADKLGAIQRGRDERAAVAAVVAKRGAARARSL